MPGSPKTMLLTKNTRRIPMRCLRMLAVWCTVLLLPTAAQAQLDETETALMRYIDAHQEEAIDLLERTVNVNSGSSNVEGVHKVGEMFRAEFDALGFETKWGVGGGEHCAGHLIARHEGNAGAHLLLIGHLDTVFEPDSPFQEYEKIDDVTVRGPGVTDMKGGNVLIVLALKAFEAAGALDDLDVTVILIGDEEKTCRPIEKARAELVAAGKEADVALGFENGDDDPGTAVISRRGWIQWTVRVKGTPAHSSLIFRDDVGAGAAYEVARVLSAFYEELRHEEYLTFNPGIVLAGTEADYAWDRDAGTASGKLNIVAENAVAAGDLRVLSPEQGMRVQAAMRRIVASGLPRTSAGITFEEAYPPMAPTEGNRRLLGLYDQVSRDLDLGPVEAVNPRNAGAADISFVAEHVDMALDGLGLLGGGRHTAEEVADLRSLPTQTKRAALLMYRLMQSK